MRMVLCATKDAQAGNVWKIEKIIEAQTRDNFETVWSVFV